MTYSKGELREILDIARAERRDASDKGIYQAEQSADGIISIMSPDPESINVNNEALMRVLNLNIAYAIKAYEESGGASLFACNGYTGMVPVV